MADTLQEILKDRGGYWLGPIQAVHSIGPYDFIEYRERNFSGDRPRFTGHTAFSICIEGTKIGRGANSLDEALLTALAYKYDGANSQASRLFCIALGIPLEHTEAINDN